MGTGALSTSWIDELIRYRRSRLPAGTSLGLVLFLGTAATAAGRPADLLGLVWMGGLAGLLIIQFRLGDDLGDLEHDRRAHPDRVLPRAATLAPFRTLLALAAGLTLLLLGARSGSGSRLLAFLALGAGLLAWYRWRPSDGPRLAAAHVPLGKYPVFVYLLTGATGPVEVERLLLVMVTVYLSFAIYEVLHDGTLRAMPGADAVLGLELLLLTALPIVGALLLGGTGRAPGALAVVATASGLLLAAATVGRPAVPLRPGARAYAVFAVGLLAVLTFSRGGAS
jgi:hypothetical protein